MTAVTKSATHRVIPNLEGYTQINYIVTSSTGYTLDVSGEFTTVYCAMQVGAVSGPVAATFSGTTVTVGTAANEAAIIIVWGAPLKSHA